MKSWVLSKLFIQFALGVACCGAGVFSQANNSLQEVDLELATLLKSHIEQADSFTDRFDAQAWLMLMDGRLKRYIKDDHQRLSMLRAIHKEATAAGIKPELVLAVIEVESHFDEFAISPVGAQGIMQIMPFWKYQIGKSFIA